jgi:hypothetical protein
MAQKSAAQLFAAAEHEFSFVLFHLDDHEARLKALMQEWEAQLNGTAPAPQSWHARQFKDGNAQLL